VAKHILQFYDWFSHNEYNEYKEAKIELYDIAEVVSRIVIILQCTLHFLVSLLMHNLQLTISAVGEYTRHMILIW